MQPGAHTDILSSMEETDKKPEISWFRKKYGITVGDLPPTIAYFSAEFGIHESLKIYSGGLGILAGDHLKSASDLGLPLVAVGLFYHQGYFNQSINESGHQEEVYLDNEPKKIPIEQCTDDVKKPLCIIIPINKDLVSAYIWKVQVGRVSLYLLDSNHEANKPEYRAITDTLYGGDKEKRLCQEMVLGIGGVRALQALGYNNCIYHMNEGHSAFLVLEVIRSLMNTKNYSFKEAKTACARLCTFTTHTPVPAGHDTFNEKLIEDHFVEYLKELGISLNEFMALGKINESDPQENFNMTVCALRSAQFCNGVSKLHGKTSRQMWMKLFPEKTEDQVPIISITNGVHHPTWMGRPMQELLNKHLTPEWTKNPAEFASRSTIETIPDESFSKVRVKMKEALMQYIEKTHNLILNPEYLTIGFARRFATYKRAGLLLQDSEQLLKLLTNTEHPLQIIYAGKAHPKDAKGKMLIHMITSFIKEHNLKTKMIFLENYDISMAKFLVAGVDMWLNNPLRPQEASGTSGMKVAFNGGLNASISDGWWEEAYNGKNGWIIGTPKEYKTIEEQNKEEAKSIYTLLETQILPLYYNQASAFPHTWISMNKEALASVCHYFSTHRMIQEYCDKAYVPLMKEVTKVCHSREGGNPETKFNKTGSPPSRE